MAIMPQIAMGFQMPQIQLPNQGNMLMQVAQLQQMQEANALRQAQARKLQLDEEQENALARLMQSGGEGVTLPQFVGAGGFTRGSKAFELSQAQRGAQQKETAGRQLTTAQTLAALRGDLSDEALGYASQMLAQQGQRDPFIAELMLTPREDRQLLASRLMNAVPGMDAARLATQKAELGIGKTQAEIAEINAKTRALGQPKPPEQTELARLLAERNALPQGDPNRAVYDQRIARLGQAPSATAIAGDKGADQWIDLVRDEARQLRTTRNFVQSLESARSLIPKATTGAGAETITAIANFARNRMGIEIDPKTVTTEELRSQLFQGILANLRQIDAQPTQQQQLALQQAIGTVGSDPQALDRILTFWSGLARARVDDFNSKIDQIEASGAKLPYDPRIKLPAPASTPTEQQSALQWARANPNDPRSAAILKVLGVSK